MKRLINRLRRTFGREQQRSQFGWALAVAVLVTLIVTTVSVVLYQTGSYAELDLSRPGYERERTEVRTSEPFRRYDTTSPVDAQAIDDFLQEYDTTRAELGEFGDFREPALRDQDLQLQDN